MIDLELTDEDAPEIKAVDAKLVALARARGAAVLTSLRNYLTGLVVGCSLGVLLGVVTGMSVVLEAALARVVRLLRPIPGLAWVPFAILWFGIDPAAAIFIIAIGVFWISYFAALSAVRAVDRELIELADAIEPVLVSEHLSWSVVDGTYLNDLLPLALTEEMLDHVARQVDRIQSRLGRRMLSALRIYTGPDHPHAAQNPVVRELPARSRAAR